MIDDYENIKIKHKGWIITYTGKQFYPMKPDPVLVCIEDIAHALSLKCRWGGHCNQFYSVAQHCVLLTQYWLGHANGQHTMDVNSIAKILLHHDDHEAYSPFGDIPRPIKETLPPAVTEFVRDVEGNLDVAIADAFGLPFPGFWPDIVKVLDSSILENERRENTKLVGVDYGPGLESIIVMPGWSPPYAEHEFLKLHKELWK